MASDKPNQTNNEKRTFPRENVEALNSLSIVLGETANDFNNILSLIFGYVEMALSEIPEGTRARSDLEHVLAAGDRAKDLIAKVLTFSNDNKLKKSEITVDKPVLNALNTFRDRLPDSITLESSIEEGSALIYGNHTEIFQVIINLLNNSLQAIDKNKGVIKLKLEYLENPNTSSDDSTSVDHSVKITVTDDGCGMDLDTMAQVFTPFFSRSHSVGDNKKLAGLGLTTAYNIINNMNGTITVDSDIDKGSVFTISLPLIESRKSVGSVDLQKPSSPAQKSLLYIDDEVAITSMARQMLEKQNYRITTFNDAGAAIIHFQENPDAYDIVITDLVMPGISGTEVAQRISACNPAIPIVLTTGFSENISSSSCHKWGITMVMHKPFAISEILSAIESLG